MNDKQVQFQQSVSQNSATPVVPLRCIHQGAQTASHVTTIPMSCFIGLDIGSTTVKAVALAQDGNILFSKYVRHFSDTRRCLANLLEELEPLAKQFSCRACITGSGGISLAHELEIPFIQEVLACNIAIGKRIPDADVVLELGGEDAKLTYITGGMEQRMNETCAGGTGAFIDQMAVFIGTEAAGMDSLAQKHATIYPIASRCGVFAKSDILPLLNEGCSREDISASIMQAVVSQTISGLAQGRPIKGKVVFLGGPLHFLPFLRARFKASLPDMQEAVFPDDGHFFVAYGAALHSRDVDDNFLFLSKAKSALRQTSAQNSGTSLPPLFENKADLGVFRLRHESHTVNRVPLESATGRSWLGFDCGSTTIKAVLINDSGQLLYSYYASNKGEPLQAALHVIKEIYSKKRPELHIAGSCATGYGSAMLTAALQLDLDEVETIAHFTAAKFFEPNVSFILDIGGQDIKCMHIKNGVVDRINLNEACSAGCGSFIENFAESLDMPLPKFVEAALLARQPVDLGTRCTVFMNSRVKQAQKEGASIGDIAAGLSYSVIRNAIFKVMKIANAAELGKHVVAQGGAFLNDALLRALEHETGIDITRPSIAGLMGAFGSALIAKRHMAANRRSSIITPESLNKFRVTNTTTHCRRCPNACLLTISTFNDKRRFVSGNRCERGSQTRAKALPNIPDYRYRRLFEYYHPLDISHAPRGYIGIPRALNIFENYPLWFTLFTRLGFSVQLSSPSSRELYYSGFDTIPSQTVCYPAKLAHGHVLDLVNRGLKTIFFPCVQREQEDADFLHGTYNCPVVAGYSELLFHNLDILRQKNINFIHNFLPLDRTILGKRLSQIDLFSSIPQNEMEDAVTAAFDEMEKFRADMRTAGEEALETLARQGKMGLILAGHPYHSDPEVHHGIAELINSCGLGVLTEDSVAHLMADPGPLRVVDQWAYHSRLYRAGAFATTVKNLAVLQLVSFGCGLDAVTADQLEEIVIRKNRLYAQIKIDEGANLGPARIRIRSILSTLRERNEQESKTAAPKGRPCCQTQSANDGSYPVFSPELRHTHTLLVPQLSPLHFQFAREIFASEGYDAILLPKVGRKAIETGLRHVNNDACYPAIVVIGQLLEAIKSGNFDPEKIAVVISQTGGGCRATNYMGFLRKALNDAGLAHVPIANFSTTMAGPGIRLTPRMLSRMIMAGHYGDAMMRMLHRLRPYEKEKGSAQALVDKWSAIAAKNIETGNLLRFQYNILAMIHEFDNLPIYMDKRRPAIGMVGEILLKYHPDANNNAAQIIEEEGGEAMVTDIMDFMLYSFYDHIYNYEHLKGSKKAWLMARTGIAFLEFTRLSLRLGFRKSRLFSMPSRFNELRGHAKKLISLGHQTGEGWLLGAEMVRMLENGANGILCMQPFGCLPNHIVGKGLIRELKRRYPHANIMALDYDAGASEVNQINRIKLMMRSGMRK